MEMKCFKVQTLRVSEVIRKNKERGRGSPRSRMGDLWPGDNLIFVPVHHFTGQNRT